MMKNKDKLSIGAKLLTNKDTEVKKKGKQLYKGRKNNKQQNRKKFLQQNNNIRRRHLRLTKNCSNLLSLL